jgi:hypothetical protein
MIFELAEIENGWILHVCMSRGGPNPLDHDNECRYIFCGTWEKAVKLMNKLLELELLARRKANKE